MSGGIVFSRRAVRQRSLEGPAILIAMAALILAEVAVVIVTVLAAGGPDHAQAAAVWSTCLWMVSLCLIRCASGRVPWFSPIGALLISHLAIFVIRPWFAVISQDSENYYTKSSATEFYLRAAMVAGLGLTAACIGYLLAYRRPTAPVPSVQPMDSKRWSKLSPLMWGIVAIGILLFVLHVVTTGWAYYWNELFLGRSAARTDALVQSSGYLYQGLMFANGALSFIFLQAVARRKKALSIATLSLILLLLVPDFVAGNRSNFLPISIALIIILGRVHPGLLSAWRVALLLPLLTFFGFIAPRIWRTDLALGMSFIGSIVSALDSSQLFDHFIGGLDMAMIDGFALQLRAQEAGEITFRFGSTYLAALTAPVPRSLWPGKPQPVDSILNQALFPETYSRHIGFSFGIYSEPFLNFGLVGVLLILAAVGVILARCVMRFLSSGDSTIVFLGAMLSGFMLPLVRGSISYDLQRLVIVVLPVLLAICLERILLSGGHAEKPLAHWRPLPHEKRGSRA